MISASSIIKSCVLWVKEFIQKSGISQFGWLNPMLLGVFPTIIILLLKPLEFNKYIIEHTDDMMLNNDNTKLYAYVDFENDNKKEKISLGNDFTGKCGLYIHDDNNNLLGQYNIKYGLAKARTIKDLYSVTDFTHDGVNELIVFTQKDDSLFLNVFDFEKKEFIREQIFITKIGFGGNDIDFFVLVIGKFDVDGDECPELFFSVSAGFALYPRRMFRYNFVNNNIVSSVNTGVSGIKGKIGFVNNDTIIVVSGNATGNCRPDYPFNYHDTSSWLFVFDKNLKLKFKPKPFGKYPTAIQGIDITDKYIVFTLGSSNINNGNGFYVMDFNGKILRSVAFDYYSNGFFLNLKCKNREYHIFNRQNNKKYYSIDYSNLNVTEFKYNKKIKDKRILFQDDINYDKTIETVCYNANTNACDLLDDNFNQMVSVPMLTSDRGIRFVTTNFKDGKTYMLIEGFLRCYQYAISNNSKYWLRFPFAFLVFLISGLFIAVVQYLQMQRIEKRKQLEQQVANLQLQNLRNQLDPHFTFNALNSVGNAIYKQNKEMAYDLFQRFTRMIRSSLMVSDKIFRSLDEELQFTHDYLEFQKTRFKTRFDYNFKVDNNIELTQVQIPKMLIQGFAENAVKHAFFGVDYKGQIEISVVKNLQFIEIVIEDNGIGINASKKSKATSGTQKGEKLLFEQVKQINKLYNRNIKVEISDLNGLGKDKNGTAVSILI